MRGHATKRSVGSALVGCAAIGVAATLMTQAAAAGQVAAGGNESFLISYGPHESEVVVAHGVVTGGGSVAAGENADTLHLGGGSLKINHEESKSKYQQHLNPTTCFASFTITGPYTLADGTGKYAGYTGHGTYTVTGNGIAKRTASGTCDQNADPVVEAVFIRASGTLTP